MHLIEIYCVSDMRPDIVVSECPGDAGKKCSGHGVCDDGVFGSGMCRCRADFTGLTCETCLTDSCVHGANNAISLLTVSAATLAIPLSVKVICVNI